MKLLPFLLTATVLCAVEPSGTRWNHEANGDINWHRVTYAGNYLYGTDNGLFSIDPPSGKVAWSREDLKKIMEFAVEEVPGSPYLYVAENTGRIKTHTRLLALDILTGETAWETEKVSGTIVDVVPDYHHNAILLFTTPIAGGSAKLDLQSLDMRTGDVLFTSNLPDKADLYVSEKSSKFFPKMDLSGHAAPAFEGDAVYVAYAGLHKFDLKSGKLLWGSKFDVTEKTLKATNATPVVGSDLVYSSAKGQIRAFDKETGTLKWTSADFGAALPEMLLDSGTLYARMGGVFLEPTQRQYALKKPIGVVALDAASGQLRWRYEGAKDSITNMVLDRGANSILIADAKNLIALSLDASGNKVKETYKVPLEWKQKGSTAGKFAKGAGKFALGGVRGLASKDPSSQDTPITLITRKNGLIVVRGKQNLLSFDPKRRETVWGSAFKAPGLSNFAKIMTTAAFAMQYMEATQRAANSYAGTSENAWANRDRQRAFQQYNSMLSRRYSSNALTNKYAYMLTDVETADGKGPGIVGVNLDSGEPERELFFKDREPEYVVDEVTGMVIRFHKGGGKLEGAPVQ